MYCTDTNEEALLKQALDMSMQPDDGSSGPTPAPASAVPDFSMMTEEDQIAYAMQLSMAPEPADTPMDTEETTPATPAATADTADRADKANKEEEEGDEVGCEEVCVFSLN